MKTKKIYFVRHGDYTLSKNGTEMLSPIGKSQIQKTAEIIRKDFDGLTDIEVYSSPAQRAVLSAKLIAKKLGDSRTKLIERQELSCGERDIPSVLSDIFDDINKTNYGAVIVSHQPDLENCLKRLYIKDANFEDFGSYCKYLYKQ